MVEVVQPFDICNIFNCIFVSILRKEILIGSGQRKKNKYPDVQVCIGDKGKKGVWYFVFKKFCYRRVIKIEKDVKKNATEIVEVITHIFTADQIVNVRCKILCYVF